jgi:hypothetical protein
VSIRDWRAQELLSKAADAERAAVVETLDAAVAAAKADHGWRSRTGAALASIRREDPKPAARGRGVLGAFGFEPIALVANTHRARSRKTGRLRAPRRWDMHGLFLEIGFRGRPGDHTIRRAADREFPHLAERLRAHLPRELRA